MILTVQCAVGSAGSKPVTVLKYANAGNFTGLVNTGGRQYGMNDGGTWQLNYTEPGMNPTDDGLPIEYNMKLNRSDFGIPMNLKKVLTLSATTSGDYPGKYELYTDQAATKASRFSRRQAGTKAVTNKREQHTYWDIGLRSNYPFVVFNISAEIMVRPSGVSNRR